MVKGRRMTFTGRVHERHRMICTLRGWKWQAPKFAYRNSHVKVHTMRDIGEKHLSAYCWPRSIAYWPAYVMTLFLSVVLYPSTFFFSCWIESQNGTTSGPRMHAPAKDYRDMTQATLQFIIAMADKINVTCPTCQQGRRLAGVRAHSCSQPRGGEVGCGVDRLEL